MRPTVLLFDIDGTLILTGGAGRRSMDGAFRRETGHADVFRDFQFGGMTDFGIVRAGLERVGRPYDDRVAEGILETYLSILPEEVDAAEQYQVLPGVFDILGAVFGLPSVAVGLGTGNIERGGRIKLQRADLSARFSFGGFGSDAENRAELLLCGATRGADTFGAPVSECRVVVIGDTPRDIDAAKKIGAECVAIATGGHPVEELREHQPEAVFADLTDEDALAAILAR